MRKLYRHVVTTAMVAAFTTGLAVSQPLHIGIADNATLGNYLVDAEGRTLYVSKDEADGSLSCVDECLETWLPTVTSGRPVTAPGLIPGFVGVVERPDGTLQASFRGYPLYYYDGDSNQGDTKGQALDSTWYVLSSTGEIITALPSFDESNDEMSDSTADLPIDAAVMELGQELYMQICVACHAADGRGGQGGPSLVDRDVMADTRRMVDQIVFGGGDMPSFGHMYDDEQIAAIATYTRNAWGNSYGPVSPEDVNR